MPLARWEQTFLKAFEVNNWLPSSPNILFEIFTGQRVAQIKEQLKDLKRIMKLKPNYEVIKVKGGEVIKY